MKKTDLRYHNQNDNRTARWLSERRRDPADNLTTTSAVGAGKKLIVWIKIINFFKPLEVYNEVDRHITNALKLNHPSQLNIKNICIILFDIMVLSK